MKSIPNYDIKESIYRYIKNPELDLIQKSITRLSYLQKILEHRKGDDYNEDNLIMVKRRD